MKKNYILIAILIVLAVLVFSIFSFAQDFSRLRRNGVFVYHGSPRTFHLLGKKPATISDVNFLAGWMTFNYINKTFNILPDYLKTQLSISDKAYPNITVSKMAKEQGTTTGAYLEEVKGLVRVYFEQNFSPQSQ